MSAASCLMCCAVAGEDKFHVFDPDLMEWTDLAFTSPLPRARSNPGMAAAGGKVYLFGGSYGGDSCRVGQGAELRWFSAA